MRRREARAAALRALFAVDLGKNDIDTALRVAFVEERPDRSGTDFVRELVSGVLEHRAEIDARIEELSRDWAVARLAAVDRNALRLGMYELLYRRGTTPVGVVINEAVELVKAYSTPESGRFVNGLLGTLARRLNLASEIDEPAPGKGEPPTGAGEPAPGTIEPTAGTQPEGGAQT